MSIKSPCGQLGKSPTVLISGRASDIIRGFQFPAQGRVCCFRFGGGKEIAV